MSRIQRLPDELVGKIAAGEVVERPASVVKELIENAVDAGAGDIVIELAAGGKASIVVRDDGCGMDAGDARLAFERHATSKIGSFEDLGAIASLGFRGEALAAIASVARIVLTTAAEDGEGIRCDVEPGGEPRCRPAARPRGTTVEVDSLFFNVPARREFLKREAAELRRVVEVVHGYALARPAIRFRLEHDGRQVFDLLSAAEAAEPVRRRVGQIFGDELAAALQAIDLELGATRIHGYVGDQSSTRGRRYFVFVNGRLVRDRLVMSSFYRAVRESWHGEQFPALFLAIDVPAPEVDVNVHPQKSEVRFRDGRLVHSVFRAVRGALEGGRAEVEAPLTAARHLAPGGLAWQGAGGRHSEVRDATAQPPAKLAEAVYRPPERTPVLLSGRSGEPRSFKLLAQYKGTLILLEGPDGLYLVDQHVAHERILYERLRSELARQEPQSQSLLEPLLLDLSTAEALRLAEWIPQLSECGFELTEMSGETIAVSAVPTVLKPAAAERLLADLAHELPPAEAETGDLRQRILDALAAGMACRSAVKMHEPLTPDTMEAMIAELFATEQPFACPHGRPTVLKMDDADLERRFGRR